MRARPANSYELFTCGWRGHVLVGTDAAQVAEADAAVVREVDGTRWYHCLRCYDWVARTVPAAPTRDRVPPREEIELPLRGKLLRDRYVLRLIAFDRAVHVTVLSALAIVIFFLAGDHSALQRDYNQIIQAFGGPSQAHPILGRFKHFFTITPTHLDEAGAVVVGYAVLEATEMVGLWFAKRWAEYLTFVATVALIPLEIYELTSSLSVLKLLTFVINAAIAAYLLWSKRLFGLNGGQEAETERLRSAVSWEALEDSLQVR
ncbi:MAG TPA: DUF2127 domain-containing protein [Acidimicrobiales bacterium]|nr:DUF2127 domain-containing protein [Acidimicrobiales bacterium]